MQKQIRKDQINLVINGMAVIAFSLWGIIKGLMSFFLREDVAFPPVEGERFTVAYMGLVVIVTFIVAAFFSIPWMYVGISAIKEGKGKKKRGFYLAVAGIMAVLDLFSLGFYARQLTLSAVSLGDVLISVFIDFTSLFTLGGLIFTGRRLRKMRKQEASFHAE